MHMSKRRLSILEEKAKLIKDEIERKKQELMQREKTFLLLNRILEEHYPEHGWCKLSKKERLRIFNKPGPRGTVKQTECGVPIHIPSMKKEDILHREFVRLVIDVIWDELERRRNQRRQKSKIIN